MSYVVLLLALLAVNPAMQAAKKKVHPSQREPTAKTALPTQEAFQKHVEQEIVDLKDDVYTRATWKKWQEVKQEADDTAGTVKLVALCAAGIGFLLGCVATVLVMKRRGGSEESLKIT